MSPRSPPRRCARRAKKRAEAASEGDGVPPAEAVGRVRPPQGGRAGGLPPTLRSEAAGDPPGRDLHAADRRDPRTAAGPAGVGRALRSIMATPATAGVPAKRGLAGWGTAGLFLAWEPLAGWRHVAVTEHRRRGDRAVGGAASNRPRPPRRALPRRGTRRARDGPARHPRAGQPRRGLPATGGRTPGGTARDPPHAQARLPAAGLLARHFGLDVLGPFLLGTAIALGVLYGTGAGTRPGVARGRAGAPVRS